ncbi:MAG: hypothetical protein IJ740_09920 [Ruminococcus sp.]|nr:hypothetical protein [Ruminococcus sp.]
MPENKAGIFRQKSIDRISSPEQLTDYLRVTNPGIWVLLAAIILLLGGLFVWSMVGNLETVADGVAVVDNGTAQIMVTDTVNGDIASGMTVRIGDDEYSIATVEKDEYGRAVAFAPIDKADGKYDVKIVTESIHPIKFLFD